MMGERRRPTEAAQGQRLQKRREAERAFLELLSLCRVPYTAAAARVVGVGHRANVLSPFSPCEPCVGRASTYFGRLH
jgi:hypothetical protein